MIRLRVSPRVARVASKPSPEKPPTPVPAKVVITPEGGGEGGEGGGRGGDGGGDGGGEGGGIGGLGGGDGGGKGGKGGGEGGLGANPCPKTFLILRFPESTIKRFPFPSKAMPTAPLMAADAETPPSPELPLVPVPTTVLMAVVETSTLRIRLAVFEEM